MSKHVANITCNWLFYLVLCGTLLVQTIQYFFLIWPIFGRIINILTETYWKSCKHNIWFILFTHKTVQHFGPYNFCWRLLMYFSQPSHSQQHSLQIFHLYYSYSFTHGGSLHDEWEQYNKSMRGKVLKAAWVHLNIWMDLQICCLMGRGLLCLLC